MYHVYEWNEVHKKLIKETDGQWARNGPKAENAEGRRNNRTRQNNKRAYRTMKSNDSPEIPGRGNNPFRACVINKKIKNSDKQHELKKVNFT